RAGRNKGPARNKTTRPPRPPYCPSCPRRYRRRRARCMGKQSGKAPNDETHQMTPATPARAALIALDWGTSSLRAYRLDDTGGTLDTRHLPWGIMRLPQPLQDGAASTALSGFDL